MIFYPKRSVAKVGWAQTDDLKKEEAVHRSTMSSSQGKSFKHLSSSSATIR
jgi:hypothetical protein